MQSEHYNHLYHLYKRIKKKKKKLHTIQITALNLTSHIGSHENPIFIFEGNHRRSRYIWIPKPRKPQKILPNFRAKLKTHSYFTVIRHHTNCNYSINQKYHIQSSLCFSFRTHSAKMLNALRCGRIAKVVLLSEEDLTH